MAAKTRAIAFSPFDGEKLPEGRMRGKLYPHTIGAEFTFTEWIPALIAPFGRDDDR